MCSTWSWQADLLLGCVFPRPAFAAAEMAKAREATSCGSRRCVAASRRTRLPRTESAWIQKRRAKIATRPQQHEEQDHEDRLLEQGTTIAAEEEPQEPQAVQLPLQRAASPPSPTAATVVPTFSTERPLPSSQAATAEAKDEEESLRSVLKSAFLSRHEKALRGLGCAAPKDLHSLSDEQLARAGLRPIEVIRLRRLLHRVRMRSPRSVPAPRPAAQPLK